MTNSDESIEREPTLRDVLDKINDIEKEMKASDEKFRNYQQATQWFVQLAFTLIASATITIIITSIFK